MFHNRAKTTRKWRLFLDIYAPMWRGCASNPGSASFCKRSIIEKHLAGLWHRFDSNPIVPDSQVDARMTYQLFYSLQALRPVTSASAISVSIRNVSENCWLTASASIELFSNEIDCEFGSSWSHRWSSISLHWFSKPSTQLIRFWFRYLLRIQFLIMLTIKTTLQFIQINQFIQILNLINSIVLKV